MAFQLKVIGGPDSGKVIPLPEAGTFLVGRGEVDTALTDGTVSRQHFSITVRGGRAYITDLRSRSGTFVNNARVTDEAPLKHADIIIVGQTHLQLLSTGAVDDTTANVPVVRPPSEPPAPTAPPAPTGRSAPATLPPYRAASQDRPSSPSLPEFGRKEPPGSANKPGPAGQAEKAHALTGLVGTNFGHFTIGTVLGVGQTGVVFRALDNRDQSEVALKVFPPEFSLNMEDVQRFTRSAKTLAQLRHLNLITLYDGGRRSGYCWLSMELVEGPSAAWLMQRAAAGHADVKAALRVLLHGTRALIYLHGKHVLHRNLTPENMVMSRADGIVKVSAMISAKAQDGAMAMDLTGTGVMLGNPSYLAPECTSGAHGGDERSDLYSLGAVVYAALVGRPPFQGTSLIDVVMKVRNEAPLPPRMADPTIPAALEDIVLRLLAKPPERRFPDATALLRHLVNHKLIDT